MASTTILMASTTMKVAATTTTKSFLPTKSPSYHHHNLTIPPPSCSSRRATALTIRNALSPSQQPRHKSPDHATATVPTQHDRCSTVAAQWIPAPFVSRFPLDEPRKGADILVEALEREGVSHVFAYPGGASLEIHQALTRSSSIENDLCRHEQGEIFAAEGYARWTGRVGVCIATSGPGATNLVSGLVWAVGQHMAPCHWDI